MKNQIQKRYCVVKDCPGRDSSNISLFFIPNSDATAWFHNLQINPSDLNRNYACVCSRHFDESCIGKRKLRNGARPTLNLGHSGMNVYPSLEKDLIPNYRYCCIVGCDSSCPPNELHRFPEDKQRYDEWLSVCVLKPGYINHKTKFICKNHFHPDMLHDKKRLKSNAVPSMDSSVRLNRINKNADALNDSEISSEDDSVLDVYAAEREMEYETEIKSENDSVLDVYAAEREAENELESGSDAAERETDSASESGSDMLDCLECNNVCIGCTQLSKDCETYRERCERLETLLKEREAKIETLQLEKEKLLTRLNAEEMNFD